MSATEVDLARLFQTLRSHLGRVIALAAIGGVLGALPGLLDRSPRYRASAEILLPDSDGEVLALSIRAIREMALSEEVFDALVEHHPEVETSDLRVRLSRQAADDGELTLVARLEAVAANPESALARVTDWQRETVTELSRLAIENGRQDVASYRERYEASSQAYRELAERRGRAREEIEAKLREIEAEWGRRLIALDEAQSALLAEWQSSTRRLFEAQAAEGARSWGPSRTALLASWSRLVQERLRLCLAGIDGTGEGHSALEDLEVELRSLVLAASMSMAPAGVLAELHAERVVEGRALRAESELAHRQMLAERSAALRVERGRLEREIDDLVRDTEAREKLMLSDWRSLRHFETWVEKVGESRAFVLRGPWAPKKPLPDLFALRVVLGVLLGLSIAVIWPMIVDLLGRRRDRDNDRGRDREASGPA